MNYENPDHNILVQRNSTGSITILNSIQSKAICALNKKKCNSNDCEYACFANLAAPSVSLLDRSRHPDTPTVHSCPFCSATANITKTVSRETLHSFPPLSAFKPIPQAVEAKSAKRNKQSGCFLILFFVTPLWFAARGKIYITEQQIAEQHHSVKRIRDCYRCNYGSIVYICHERRQ